MFEPEQGQLDPEYPLVARERFAFGDRRLFLVLCRAELPLLLL
jgi:hypothetical protein